MGKYHVFLSCKDDITINNEKFNDLLNKKLPKDKVIECIKKHDDLSLAKEDVDDLEESCIYVVDTHKDLDNLTYWELGYAMGKGIEVIGYYDGKSVKKIPSDVEKMISIPRDITRFLEKINRALEKRKPKDYPLNNDWDKQHTPATKEAKVA